MREYLGIGANGLSIYRDLDGDNLITDKDRVSAGSALPTTVYSFYASAAHKGFDLSVNFY